MKRILLALVALSPGFASANLTELQLQRIPFYWDQKLEFQPANITEFGLSGTQTVSLTFDDGPYRETTPLVLDILAAHGIKATFFLKGAQIPGNEDLLDRMFNEGHLIANHSTYHKNLASKNYQNSRTIVQDLSATHELIRKYLRDSDMWFFRAPFGNWLPAHAKYLNRSPELRRYIGPIYWTIGGAIPKAGVRYGAADWDCWDRGYSAQTCLTGYIAETQRRGGGVVLMHDVDPKTAAMLDGYVTFLKSKNFSFVRLDEVKALEKFRPSVPVATDSLDGTSR